MQQCYQCGTSCTDSAKFCGQCGCSLQEFVSVLGQPNDTRPTDSSVHRDDQHRADLIPTVGFNQQQQKVDTQYNAGQDINVTQRDPQRSTQRQRATEQQGRTQYNAGRDINFFERIQNILFSPPEAQQRQNRINMLDKVRTYWIEGFLEQSLHKVAMLELGMRYKPDAVEYSWDMLVQQPDRQSHSVPPGTTIADVFDQLSGELLILGTPGSGKTMMLLELARTLINQAEHDEYHPMPVIFNLSSWAEKRLPLDIWLIEELNTRYDIPRRLAKTWIDSHQILPLLDGLDEVRCEQQAACIEAINTYKAHRAHGVVRMVVCSRIADYEVLITKLRLQGAIVLQPLTTEQIETYLHQTTEKTETIRTVLHNLQESAKSHNDPEAFEFTKTPLMLSITMLAYQDTASSLVPLSNALPAEQQRHLFATYVARMFKRRGQIRHYTPDQANHWLSWLAERMVEHEQTLFLIERMPASCLSKKMTRQFYAACIGGIVGLSVCGLLIGLPLEQIFGVIGDWGIGVPVGSVLGLAFGLDSWRRGKIEPVETLQWSWANIGSNLRNAKWFWLILGFLLGSIFVLMGIAVALVASVPLGLLAAFVPTAGLLLVATSLLGLSSGNELSNTAYPNQGIWLSFRNCCVVVGGITIAMALLPGGVGVLFGAIMGGWGMALHAGIAGAQEGAMLGVMMGLFLGGLFFGGLPFIQHFLLRLILVLSRHTPWNYVRFLDYATERIFLRKVGGGYIFIHRMLMEYFASLTPEEIANLTRKP